MSARAAGRRWTEHEGVRRHHVKRFRHPQVGALELNCQTLLDPEQSHRLVVYTAVPGSESHDRLRSSRSSARRRCADRPGHPAAPRRATANPPSSLTVTEFDRVGPVVSAWRAEASPAYRAVVRSLIPERDVVRGSLATAHRT
ncbi:MmyB family transcriptional regulator [Streptomyces sp. NPDC054844]